uniref:HAT C-terminal dimerisation domain-containing protein n=2 Tax=Timema TaxID=61471 RepID=A0A7R8VMT5_TIMDO|nr:unnamed protein product [Timema douglasi]
MFHEPAVSHGHCSRNKLDNFKDTDLRAHEHRIALIAQFGKISFTPDAPLALLRTLLSDNISNSLDSITLDASHDVSQPPQGQGNESKLNSVVLRYDIEPRCLGSARPPPRCSSTSSAASAYSVYAVLQYSVYAVLQYSVYAVLQYSVYAVLQYSVYAVLSTRCMLFFSTRSAWLHAARLLLARQGGAFAYAALHRQRRWSSNSIPTKCIGVVVIFAAMAARHFGSGSALPRKRAITTEDNWTMDSGASAHMTNHRDYFSKFEETVDNTSVVLGNNQGLSVKEKGIIKVKNSSENKHARELIELEASAPPRRPSLDAKEKRALKKGVSKGHVSGIVQPYIYSTTVDGTVQIDGDIQFITDPNINLQGIDDDTNSGNLSNNVQTVVYKSAQGSSKQNVSLLLSEENCDNHPQMVKSVVDAIAEFIIIDLHVPDIVEGRGFQRLIATLRSPCEIPSKTKLEEDFIPKIYDTFKESEQTTFSKLDCAMCLSAEEWSSGNGETFITVSVHYQPSQETLLETRVLATLHCSVDMDITQWIMAFDSLLAEWYIKLNNITAVVVATSIPELINALSEKGLVIVPCLVYTLQLCASACFTLPEVATILGRCRSLISQVTRIMTGNTSLRIQEHNMLQMEEGSLTMDYPHVWTSTYVMMEQLILRKGFLQSLMDGNNKNDIMLNDPEFHILEDLVTVLEPFKVTIMTLGDEKMPLISLVRPLLWQLTSSHLKIKDTDSDAARLFKECISANLSEKYSEPAVSALFEVATTLDPRFKLLKYGSEEEKNVLLEPVKTMLVKLVQDETSKSLAGRSEVDMPAKKSRLSGMEFLLGDLCSNKPGMPATERANLELVQYHSEETISLEQCPLQWWSKASLRCPNLSQLARRYNCIPACAMPPTRIPTENQVSFDMKRASLSTTLVDKMLFLHGNHNI